MSKSGTLVMALRKFAPAFVLAALAPLPVLAADTDHSYTLLTVNTQHAIFADEGAHMVPGGYIKLTLLTVPGLETAAYQLSQVEISCGASMLIDINAIPYKADARRCPPPLPIPRPNRLSPARWGKPFRNTPAKGPTPIRAARRLPAFPTPYPRPRA
jgi:hypothetical protein